MSEIFHVNPGVENVSLCAAATFFCTYELTKAVLSSRVPQEYVFFVHMLAASAGEVVGVWGGRRGKW